MHGKGRFPVYRKWKHSGSFYRSTYVTWKGMLNRCNSVGTQNYPKYGGRGIKVCRRWRNFDRFVEDMGVRPFGTSLDRINNDGNYSKRNCRWATPRIQGRNRRTNRIIIFRGQSRTLIEWAEILGTSKVTLGSYIRRHSVDAAINRYLSKMEF